MKSVFLLAAVFLGCDSVYEVPCLGRVTSEAPIDVADTAAKAELAVRLIEEYAGGVSHCQLFERTATVHVRSATEWTLPDGIRIDGEYRRGHLELGATAASMVHELLHHLDYVYGIKRADPHEGWGENGFRAADRRFTYLILSAAEDTESPP